MAVSCLNAVRVKLYFDYPPPSLPDCRMSWLLVDLNKCRLAADLASVIREKFDYSRKTVLDLFIEDCYVPPSESIYVVRDNDSIRVKVSSVYWSTANSVEHHSTAGKKRCREEEEEEQVEGASQAPAKKEHIENQVNGFTAPADKSKKKGVKEKKKKKKKKKKEEEQTEHASVAASEAQPARGSNKTPTSTVSASGEPAASCGKPNETSDSSDSSEEALQKPPPPKLKARAEKTAVARRPAATAGCLGSSSEWSSSEDDAAPAAGKVRIPVKPSGSTLKASVSTNSKTPPAVRPRPSSDSSSSSSPPPDGPQAPAETPPAAALSSHTEQGGLTTLSTPVAKEPQRKPECSDSYSSSETELVIRRPNPKAMGLTPAGVAHRGGGAVGRGRGDPRGTERGRGRSGGRSGYGKARGTPWKQGFHSNYEGEELQRRQDFQTNKSLLLQNPAEPEPRRDYSVLPLLAGPPAEGQMIAFKLLELTESYTPEVSAYKEAKIIGFNHATKMIELELLSQTPGRSEPGKFDLVYQNPDGSERVEYAVTHGSQLTERWDSLLEPRLIVESTG
ncbi:coilin [Electrophorus electricus]|uniref:Coilin n=1 Tax=Electrophorus electricus TaxID=8005 RepID=A0A4W4EEB1_ELEEL|nr:coilin [Electrophorus electricus]